MNTVSWRQLVVACVALVAPVQHTSPLPAGPLAFGAFTAQFRPDGTFSMEGQGWPAMSGTWTVNGSRIELALSQPLRGCEAAGSYEFRVSGNRVTFEVVTDSCEP